jgi:Na+-driven multidrug efflux pump
MKEIGAFAIFAASLRKCSTNYMTEQKIAEKSLELGHEKIPRLMWRYFVPAFIGVIMNATYNIVDRIFMVRALDLMPCLD